MANIIVTSDPATHLLSTTGAVPLINNDTTNNIIIASGGVVANTGTGDAVRLGATTGTHQIIVHGDVRSIAGAAITLSPTGTIVVAEGGLLSSNTTTVLAQQSLILNNAGTMTGARVIEVRGDTGSIVNTGNIFASSTSLSAIFFNGSPVVPSLNTLFNAGTIAAVGTAIQASATSAGIDVTNLGQILGGISTSTSLSNDRIINGGLIVGSIDLGAGGDTYDARQGGLVQGFIELGSGNDTYFGSDSAEDIASSSGNDLFDLGGGNDTYRTSAGDGNDTIDGGNGVDTLDLTALASVAVDLTLGKAFFGAEVDTLSNLENILATNGSDQLVGNAASNRIEAFFGNDILDGRGAGADVLIGGADNDTYFIDAGDTIIDASGVDLVQSSILSLDLAVLAGGAIENATLLGASALSLKGNAAANVLIGNGAANTLTGAGGADQLDAGAGNDTYVIDAADTITADAAGIDTVKTDARSLNLATLAGGKLEHATLFGAGNFNLDGSSAANALVGNAGANRLNGKEGNDALSGAAGNDVFLFTTKLSATSNVDTITDFSVPADILHLENTGVGLFNGLAAGALSVARFKANATGTATDADDRIIYNTSTGSLFFDSNGSAAGGSIKFAVIANKAALTAGDFFVI